MRERRDAQQILRDHVTERHLRAAVRGQDLSGDPSAQPRMNEEAWIESCALVTGIPNATLALLHHLWCAPSGVAPRMRYIEAGGGIEVVQDWAARPCTLADAARAVGIPTREATRMHRDALRVVSDRLWERMEREEAR